jgi:hypothetical protein
MSAYVASNLMFVQLWAGVEYAPNAFLTILIAFQGFFSGSSYLANCLYRATGEIKKGSIILVLEAGQHFPYDTLDKDLRRLWRFYSGNSDGCCNMGARIWTD